MLSECLLITGATTLFVWKKQSEKRGHLFEKYGGAYPLDLWKYIFHFSSLSPFLSLYLVSNFKLAQAHGLAGEPYLPHEAHQLPASPPCIVLIWLSYLPAEEPKPTEIEWVSYLWSSIVCWYKLDKKSAVKTIYLMLHCLEF